MRFWTSTSMTGYTELDYLCKNTGVFCYVEELEVCDNE